MEIEFIRHRINPVKPASGETPVQKAKTERDRIELAGQAALEAELEQVPATRSEKVERARQLIGSVQYPPDSTINRIADLLAMHLQESTQG